MDSVRVYFRIKSIFHIFVQVHASEKNFFDFLTLVTSRVPPKLFYAIDTISNRLLNKSKRESLVDNDKKTNWKDSLLSCEK